MTTSWAATGDAALPSGSKSVTDLLDEAPRSKFHRRTVVVSGVGFFTDAYDLFVIGTVSTIVATQWHLSTLQTSWVTGAAILGAFFGALVFGRIADVLGRKWVYLGVAVIMIIGAVASAVAPGFVWLVIARFVLGLGIGGDYPVSAVLMSEYSNRKDRGRLVGMVFSMQALGLIVGPLVGLLLLSSGMSQSVAWRLLLGFGAIPAAGVIYLRSKMPESPRFKAQVQGETHQASADLATFSDGVVDAGSVSAQTEHRMGVKEFFESRRMLVLLLGTAGSWFLFDYAYYGNTLSLPAILKEVDSTASLETKLLWTLGLVRRLRSARLCVGCDEDGSDRPPSTSVHRLRRNGGRLPHLGRLCTPDDDDRAVPGDLWTQLLLRSVRAEHDHLRPSVRGVPSEHAHDRAWHCRRHREAGGILGRLPGSSAAEALRAARNALDRRRGGCPGVCPDQRAARTRPTEPRRHAQ